MRSQMRPTPPPSAAPLSSCCAACCACRGGAWGAGAGVEGRRRWHCRCCCLLPWATAFFLRVQGPAAAPCCLAACAPPLPHRCRAPPARLQARRAGAAPLGLVECTGGWRGPGAVLLRAREPADRLLACEQRCGLCALSPPSHAFVLCVRAAAWLQMDARCRNASPRPPPRPPPAAHPRPHPPFPSQLSPLPPPQ